MAPPAQAAIPPPRNLPVEVLQRFTISGDTMIATVANRGEMFAPCGVPLSVARQFPFSIGPAMQPSAQVVEVFLQLLRPRRFRGSLALSRTPVLPSASLNSVGSPDPRISQLNASPVLSPVNASKAPSRMRPTSNSRISMPSSFSLKRRKTHPGFSAPPMPPGQPSKRTSSSCSKCAGSRHPLESATD